MIRNGRPFRFLRLAPRLASLTVIALLLGSAALAQVSYDLGGKVTADFGVAVDGTIPVAAAGLELRLSGEVGSGFFPDAIFMAEVSAAYDAADRESPFSARLGRAYATVYLGSVDLSVGNQVVSWGSADVLSPVDVINPRDLSYPISDPATQKLAVPMLRAVAHASDVTLDLVVVPVFVPSTVPGARWQPAMELPTTLPLPPGVTLVGVAPPLEARPAFELANVQFGLRGTLDLNVGGGADVSAVYYRGFRHLPTVGFLPVPAGPPGAVTIQPLVTYDPIQLLGADFSAVVGQFVLRGEAAYTFAGEAPSVETELGPIPLPAGVDEFSAVLGAETVVSGGPFLSVQAVYQHTAEGEEALLPAPATNSFSTAVVANYEPNNRTGLDMAWLHSWSDGSGVLRPSMSYTFADGLVGTAEAAVFYGRDGSEYGAWRDNSQIRVGVAFSF